MEHSSIALKFPLIRGHYCPGKTTIPIPCPVVSQCDPMVQCTQFHLGQPARGTFFPCIHIFYVSEDTTAQWRLLHPAL